MDLPYFRVFAAETIADERFASWTAAERGVWFTLLLHAWTNESIPADEKALSRLSGMTPKAFRIVWATISDRFVPHPEQRGRLTSRRLEVEREDAMSKSRAGRKGAESRWKKSSLALGCGDANADAASMRSHSDGNATVMPAAQRSATHLSAAQQPEPQPQPPAASGPPPDDVPPKRLEVVDEASSRADGPPAFPLAVEFRHLLAERLARTAPHPVGGGRSVWESLERALAVVPPGEAVEVCAERVFESVAAGRRQPGTLGYFAQVLADEVTKHRAAEAAAAAFTPAVALEDLPAIEFEA